MALGQLIVNLVARTSAFDRKMRKSRTSIRGMTRDIKNTQRVMLGYARTALAVAGVGGIGYLIKQTASTIDVTAKMSDRLEIATEDLVSMQHAAKITGMSTEGMNKAIETFVRRLGEVKMGVGQARYALDALGLSADEMVNRDHIENLKLIADRISQIKNASEKASAAYYLFGRQGQQMLNLLNEGSKGIEEFRKEAERLGITFSRLDAAQIEEMNDQLTRAKSVLGGLVQRATIELSPVVIALTDDFIDAATAGKGFGDHVVDAMRQATRGVAYLKGVVGGLKAPFLGISAGALKMAQYAVEAFIKIGEGVNRVNDAIAGTAFGKLIGFEKSKSDSLIELQAWAGALNMQSNVLTKQAADALKGIGNTKEVDKFFDRLETRKNEIEANIKARRGSGGAGAGTAGAALFDEKEIKRQVSEFIKSQRHMYDMTRMERIEYLRDYVETNQEALNQVGEANKMLEEEIERIERSRVDRFKVWMSEVREDMQSYQLYVSEKFVGMANTIESGLSNAFYRMGEEGARWKDVMVSLLLDIKKAFIKMVADMIARWIMFQMVTNIMPGVGSLFGLGGGGATSVPSLPSPAPTTIIAHSGGRAGSINSMRSLTSPLWSDETLAVLKKNERVIPEGATMAAVSNAPSVIINNNTGRPMETSGEPRWNGEEWVTDIIVRDISIKRGRVHRAIEGMKKV